MLLLAASTTVEKLQALPLEVWLKAGGVLAGFVIAVAGLRRLSKVNPILLAIGGTTVSAIVFFSMVYYRSEPKWLSPVIDVVAPFLPSEKGYEIRQAGP